MFQPEVKERNGHVTAVAALVSGSGVRSKLEEHGSSLEIGGSHVTQAIPGRVKSGVVFLFQARVADHRYSVGGPGEFRGHGLPLGPVTEGCARTEPDGHNSLGMTSLDQAGPEAASGVSPQAPRGCFQFGVRTGRGEVFQTFQETVV